MKKNVKEKKRILSLILAVVMVVTMMPMQVVAAATDSANRSILEQDAQQTDLNLKNDNQNDPKPESSGAASGNDQNGKGDLGKPEGSQIGETKEPQSDGPEVSISWTPKEREEDEKADQGTVELKAALTDMEQDFSSSVNVEIKLEQAEAAALSQFWNEDGKLDQNKKLETENQPAISLKEQKENGAEAGDVSLCFALSSEKEELNQDIEFQLPSDATEPLEIKVKEEDITVTTSAENGETQNVDVTFTTSEDKVLTLSVPEKNDQEENAENNTPTDDEDTEDTNGEPVNEGNSDENGQVKDEEAIAIDEVVDAIVEMTREDLIACEKEVEYGGQDLTQDVFWADNRDEEGIRPNEDTKFWTLSYAMTKEGDTKATETYKELTTEDLNLLDMKNLPIVERKEAGVNRDTLTIAKGTLPNKITYTSEYGDVITYTINWKLSHKDVVGYDFVDVTVVDEAETEYQCELEDYGWYYVLKTEFRFDTEIRQGTNNTSMETFKTAIDKHFQLQVTWKGAEYQNVENAELSNSGTEMAYENLWKYNLDGSRMTYQVVVKEKIEEEQKDKIYIEGLDKGDYFVISYDNAEAPNYGSVVTQIHDGGTLELTLTGKNSYQATKKWSDEGVKDAEDKRPTGELQLWRYRSGESHTSAAPVRDKDGNILTLKLEEINLQKSPNIQFGISEELLGDDKPTLEKYDTEGYRYVYVVREYLDSTTKNEDPANSYDQIFGEVTEDDNGNLVIEDTVPGKTRADNDTFLYNGGTLTNKISDTVTVKGVKKWKAAAFQAEFEDVTVELTLQSRPAGEQDAAWTNTAEVVTLDDFYAENLSGVSFSRTMPKYDDLGRELEYQWVESKVTQNGSENLLEQKEDGAYFTLNQNGDKVRYRSESTTDEAGNITIINSLADEIKYDVKKVWLDKNEAETNAPENAEVTFNLYRTISGQKLEEGEVVAKFSMDGVADEEETCVNENLDIYAKETHPWQATVSPLAEYDEEGRLYEYTLLEVGNLGNFVPSYTTEKDEDGNYSTTVYNGYGGNHIMVLKEWTDNSDITHREKVNINVYASRNITNEEGGLLYAKNDLVNSVTLGENDVWDALVGIGSLDPKEDVYILETQVGDTEVPLSEYNLDSDAAPNFKDPEEPGEDTVIQYETENHKYEATYYQQQVEGETIYTVDNRRLGNVNLKATKKWVDGKDTNGTRKALKEALDEEGFSLALKLNFSEMTVQEEYYKITRAGYQNGGSDTVTIAPNSPTQIRDAQGNKVSSIQKIDFEKNTSEVYFYNLPKYDKTGKVVNYEISEVVVDAGGNVVNWDTLQKEYADIYNALKQYQTSIVQTDYKVGDQHDLDEQKIEVTNRLQGSKDIQWHKQWKDAYMYEEGQRPDIYLDIYQTKHVSKDGNDVTETTLFQKDYKWTAKEGEETTSWTAQLPDVPKYDDLGYEIMYYAVEKTKVNSGAFDYQEIGYAITEENDLTIFGSESGVNEGNEKYEKYLVDISAQEKAAEPHYALQEDGTFINTIANTVKIQGQKVWSSLPAGDEYLENLPSVTFHVMQKLDGENEKKVAELTIESDEWAALKSKGSYLFQILYKRTNDVEITGEGSSAQATFVGEDGAELLPKYNKEGQLYQYTLKEEKVIWPSNWEEPEWTEIYDAENSNTYIMKNVYKSPTGALKIKKFLAVPMDENGEPVFPAVTFKLTRTYTGNDRNPIEDEEFSRTITWGSEEVEETYNKNENLAYLEWVGAFEDLELYAPNGSEYVYTVEEVKTELQGYQTWVAAGDVGVNAVNKEGTKVENLKPDKEATKEDAEVKATFKNKQYSNKDTVTLTGEKKWQDYNNAFYFRPDQEKFGEGLTLKRSADPQTGQDNGIDSQEVAKDKYTITWNENPDKGNTWTYTIKGSDASDELEKYAPNGMPWEYQITEEISEHYTASPDRGTVSEKTEKNDVITMNPLTNSIMESVDYQKLWKMEDKEGTLNDVTEDYFQQDLTVTFRLQVKAGKDGGWENASDYFKETLDPTAYESVFGFKNTEESAVKEYFTPFETARINAGASAWSGTIKNLPKTIKGKNEEEINLAYRVVEDSITAEGMDGISVTVKDGENSQYYYEFKGSEVFKPGVTETNPNAEQAKKHTNILPTTELTVQKVWEGDYQNAYGTRPTTKHPGDTWETTFVIQRSIDNGEWEPVKVTEQGETGAEDLTVTLCGTDSEDEVANTITGLPKTDLSGETYQYRAREVKAGLSTEDKKEISAEELITGEDNNNIYNDTYKVTYNEDGTTVTNMLQTTQIAGQKIWNTSKKDLTATLCLEYGVIENGKLVWKKLAKPNTEVKLDGATDTPEDGKFPYYEKKEWIAVWEDLPLVIPGSTGKYTNEAGKTVEVEKTLYRVKETSVASGHSQVVADSGEITLENKLYSAYKVTNTETTTYKVEKKWGGTPTGKVKIQLYRTTGEIGNENSEAVGEPIELTGNGSYLFKKLPKYADRENGNTNPGTGREYKYFAREIAVQIEDSWKYLGEENDKEAIYEYLCKDYPKYTDTEAAENAPAQTTIVNVVKIDITVQKNWKDNNNNYTTRPEDLTVTLWRNGEKVNDATPTEWAKNGAVWTCTFEDLPAADGKGELYTYTVKETDPTIAGNADKEVDANSDKYTASEDGTATVSNNECTLTNTLTGTTEVSVTKEWIGGDDSSRPEVTVRLYRNGNAVENKTATLTSGNWTHTWKELPKYDANGALYTYTVKEEKEANGVSTIDGQNFKVEYNDQKVGYNFNTDITNTELTSLNVEKVWSGVNNPGTITVGLYRITDDGESAVAVADGNNNKALELTADNGWTAQFVNMPKYGIENGKEVTYTYYAREMVKAEGSDDLTPLPEEIAGTAKLLPEGLYSVSHKGTDEDGKTTITNVGKTTIEGTKTWVDNGDAYGTRPENLELRLTRHTGDASNAELVKDEKGNPLQPTWTKPAKEDANQNEWTYSYGTLPAADENGKTYTYVIREVEPELTDGDQYNDQKAGNNFTNTLTGKTDISVTKTWRDGSDAQNARPDSIKVQLYKTIDGTEDETAEDGPVELNSANNWQYSWEDLDKYTDDQQRITYTVKELNASGEPVADNGKYDSNYRTVYGGSEENGYTITNTLTTSQSVTKIWEGDEGDLENPVERPTEIKAELYAGGEATGRTATLNANNGWSYTWTNLAEYSGGSQIDYTVKELDAEGNPVAHEGMYNEDYTAFYATDTSTGKVTITNFHQPDQYMYLGQVNIRKDVVVGEGETAQPQKVTDTFYVALFEDKALTTMATDYDGNKAMAEIAFNGESSKTVTIGNMPVGPTGHPVTYYAAEVDQNGNVVDDSFKYQATVTKGEIQLDIKNLSNEADPVVITNAFGNTLTALSGTKIWAGDDESMRPESIEVILQQNGQDYVDASGDKYTLTVTAADDWSYTFENLPEYDMDGKPYEYSVKEGYVEGYTAAVNGMDLQNTLEPEDDYEGYYYEGTVRITKQVLLKGDDYNVKDVYYAGIFNDKDYKDPLTNDDGSQYIVPLVLDDESETTVEITVPFNKADSAEYYITEVDENGVPVKDAKGLEYKASVKGGKVVLDTEDTEGDVTIVNSYDKEKKGNPNAPNTSDTPGGSGTQTGDNSNMTLLILTMLMALTLMGVLALGRKRKKS